SPSRRCRDDRLAHPPPRRRAGAGGLLPDYDPIRLAGGSGAHRVRRQVAPRVHHRHRRGERTVRSVQGLPEGLVGNPHRDELPERPRRRPDLEHLHAAVGHHPLRRALAAAVFGRISAVLDPLADQRGGCGGGCCAAGGACCGPATTSPLPGAGCTRTSPRASARSGSTAPPTGPTTITGHLPGWIHCFAARAASARVIFAYRSATVR